MWYIEKLVREIEFSLSGSNSIYEAIEVDLSPAEIASIRKEIEAIRTTLGDAKKSFGLKVSPVRASRIIEVDAGFIWETVEDTHSSRLEKGSGKIDSPDEKKRIDEFLHRIMSRTNRIRKIVGESEKLR